MRKCMFPHCNHGSKGLRCKMHHLPSSPSEARRWMAACHLAGSPRILPAAIYVCSCHFLGERGPTRENPDPVTSQAEQIVVCEEGRKGSLRNKPKWERHRKAKQSTESKSADDESTGSKTTASALEGHIAEMICESMEDNPSKNTDTYQSPLHMPQERLSSLKSSALPNSENEAFQQYADLAQPLQCSPDLCNRSEVYGADKYSIQEGNQFSLGRNWNTKERSNKVNKKKDGCNNCGGGDGDGGGGGGGPSFRNMGVQADFAIFSYEKSLSWSDEDFRYFTWITHQQFEGLYKFLDGDRYACSTLKYIFGRRTPKRNVHSSHSHKGKLFMTLVRLRRGYSLKDMEMMFKLPKTTISQIFYTWIRFMSIKFKPMENAMFVSVAAQKDNLPDCYKAFPNLRCVVDGTEIYIQKPDNMEQQSNTFSSYKGCNTVKFLIVTSLLSFISEGMEGSVSDRKLFLKSGIVEHLNAGEAVMADRGFDVESDLNKIGVELLIPAFLGNREAFTAREIILSKSIAAARIHVETFIGRMKCFKLIRHVLPNTMLDIVSDIVRVCACLVNFQDSFIRWETCE